LLFYTLNRFGLFRVPKEIEIMGLDIAEMGGVSENVYSKLRKEFGAGSPLNSALLSTNSRIAKRKSMAEDNKKSMADDNLKSMISSRQFEDDNPFAFKGKRQETEGKRSKKSIEEEDE
jgi:hypothetical protein